jgi:glucokinase
MFSVGIDVGGTGIKGVRLDDGGIIVDHAEDPSTPDQPDTLVATIIDQARRLGVGPDVPLGVAVAAFLDPERQIVQFSPNISWTNRALARELSDTLQVPVVLDNDANAACFGEFRQGAGRDARTLAMFTLGTGVGGAVMESGRVLVGFSGTAGELGHMPIVSGGRQCGCGLSGCLETIASGTAIIARVREATGLPQATADDVSELLRTDSELRELVFAEVADALVEAIVTLRAVINPDTVVIGGGVMDRAGVPLLDMISRRLHDRLSEAAFAAIPTLVAATLGNRAGGIGAALLAREYRSRTL